MTWVRILLGTVLLTAGAAARADDAPMCRTGHEGQYVVWNFDRGTSAFFDAQDFQDELDLLRDRMEDEFRPDAAPSVVGSPCRNDALLSKLETRRELGDLGDFVLVGLTGKGKDLEVHILPYIVAQDQPRLITRGACTQNGPVPASNVYRSEIRAYAYAALALAELRRVETSHDVCRARHAQFFLNSALDAMVGRAAGPGPDVLADRQLQRHLKDKQGSLQLVIDAAAKTSNRCGMPAESARLAELRGGK